MHTRGGRELIGIYIPTVIMFALSPSPQVTNTTFPVGPTWSLLFSANSVYFYCSQKTLERHTNFGSDTN